MDIDMLPIILGIVVAAGAMIFVYFDSKSKKG